MGGVRPLHHRGTSDCRAGGGKGVPRKDGRSVFKLHDGGERGEIGVEKNLCTVKYHVQCK